MDERFKRRLEEAGMEVDVVLKRFMGNEAMYQKFLLKFVDDKNYEGLVADIEKRDYEEAFKKAHTLKGVTANLGIEPVRSVAARITDLLRNKKEEDQVDSELDEYKEQLQTAYEEIREIILEEK